MKWPNQERNPTHYTCPSQVGRHNKITLLPPLPPSPPPSSNGLPLTGHGLVDAISNRPQYHLVVKLQIDKSIMIDYRDRDHGQSRSLAGRHTGQSRRRSRLSSERTRWDRRLARGTERCACWMRPIGLTKQAYVAKSLAKQEPRSPIKKRLRTKVCGGNSAAGTAR